MFFNSNQVMLMGYISDGHIKKFISSNNQLSIIFQMRTEDAWLSKDGNIKKRYDFHNIILKDVGKREIASKYMSIIIPGNKIIVQGRLRSHLTGSEWWSRISEVDCNSIELIGINADDPAIAQKALLDDVKNHEQYVLKSRAKSANNALNESAKALNEGSYIEDSNTQNQYVNTQNNKATFKGFVDDNAFCDNDSLKTKINNNIAPKDSDDIVF